MILVLSNWCLFIGYSDTFRTHISNYDWFLKYSRGVWMQFIANSFHESNNHVTKRKSGVVLIFIIREFEECLKTKADGSSAVQCRNEDDLVVVLDLVLQLAAQLPVLIVDEHQDPRPDGSAPDEHVRVLFDHVQLDPVQQGLHAPVGFTFFREWESDWMLLLMIEHQFCSSSEFQSNVHDRPGELAETRRHRCELA